MSGEEGSFLPTKSTKLWKKKNVKSKDWKPLTPNFCPCVDPETEKKCGNFMRSWDIMFYDQYGMCEECYLKYNDGDGVKVTDTDPEAETKNDDD
jgi:hypothetical protein